MNASTWADNDDGLLAELRLALAERASVPDEAAAAAAAAFELRALETEYELLVMQYDSSTDGAALVRGVTDESLRTLSFQGAGLTFEVELGPDAIVGQLVPAVGATVALDTGTGTTVTADVDEIGCFLLERPSGGPFRLICHTETATLVTSWIGG